jgi:hypothetical protein
VALCQEDIVHTPNGIVQGVVGDVYRVFKGIPYATPPTGELRWAPPLPAKAWPGVLNATGNNIVHSLMHVERSHSIVKYSYISVIIIPQVDSVAIL